MRKASGRTVQTSSRALMLSLRLAAVALGIGLVMTSGAVRAADDEDDKTFEEKIRGHHGWYRRYQHGE